MTPGWSYQWNPMGKFCFCHTSFCPFCFCHSKFWHFAFALPVLGNTSFLPYVGQNQNENGEFWFCFCPYSCCFGFVFATQKGKSKMSKLRVAKVKWAKTKYSWNITNHVVLIPPKNYANIRSRLIVNRWWKLKRRFRVFIKKKRKLIIFKKKINW